MVSMGSPLVDDTLVLAKPSDFPFVLNKLNCFHIQLQFTIDSFTDDQDIHFLDIKITPNGTSVHRKSTHTGQYVHLSSFTPWYRKTAWLRALIHRAYKLYSNSEILSIELSEIYKFASWNGFPKRLTKNLPKQFAPNATNNLTNNPTDLLINNISHQATYRRFGFRYHLLVNEELLYLTIVLRNFDVSSNNQPNLPPYGIPPPPMPSLV